MNSKSTFLLVEDSEDDVFFMRRAFRDAGFSNPLQVVTNGEEAIEYLSGAKNYSDRNQYPEPQLVFLDLKMPGLDGFEVLAWIRQKQKLTVPVAVLTSSPEEVDRRRAGELGADCYLLKPPTPGMLVSCCKLFNLDCG